MKSVRRSVILPYPATALYALVADVESYPEFLPGCVGAAVKESDPETVVATLEMARGVLRGKFTTRNRLKPPYSMTMDLLGGSFRRLHGEWTFNELDDSGCEVVLTVSFKLASQIAESLIGSQVERFCADLVSAFVRRARDLHG